MSLLFNVSYITGEVLEFSPTHAETVAPAAIWLDAPDFQTLADGETPVAPLNYRPSFHKRNYIWTVRGSPLSAFTATRNIPDEWNDPNTAYGQKVAFCLPEAGDYIFDLMCVDSNGLAATGYTTTVTVTDPDVEFAGTNTVVYADDGIFTGKPSGAQEASTISGLETILSAASAPIRVLFKAGETVDVGLISLSGSRRMSYVSRWGTGANPVIKGGWFMSTNYPENSIRFVNVDFQGNWDILTGTGFADDNILNRASANNANFTTTYYGCTVKGKGVSFNQTAGSGLADDRMMVCNCVATDNRSLAIYTQNVSDDGRTAIIGNDIAQNPQAISMDNGGFLANGGGGMRLSDTKFAYVAMNNFFAHTGAFGLGNDMADSACIRLNTSCIADVDYVVERNFCEGGYIPVQAVSSNSNDHDKGGNYLIDKMIIAHTAGTVGVSIQTGRGMTIRNVAAYMPDTLYRYFGGSGVQRSLVSIKPTGTVAGNADEPLTIHNCTLLSDQSQANEYSTSGSILEYYVMQVEDISASESFTAITEENNVVQNADSAKPSTAEAPIDTTVNFSGITPDYAGKRWDYEHVSITVASTTTNIGESFVVAYSEIGSTTVGGVDVAGTTDQAYWQALPAENDSHQLRIDGNNYSSEGGDFTVAYEAGGVRFTNTSIRNWTSYTDFTFKLDRHTAIPAMDTSQANPANIPIPRILTGSLTAAQTASNGAVSREDVLGTIRSGTKVKGAVALV